jgi:(R)-2-hydroxyacyl-CoA dehydratese activating ATPase
MGHLVAGIDAGSYSVKAVVLGGGELLSMARVINGRSTAAAATDLAIAQALSSAGLEETDLGRVVATGSAADQVVSADGMQFDSLCIACGLDQYAPNAGRALDVGAQHCLAISFVDGHPDRLARTDSCAAGVGIFLNVVSELLEIPVSDMGRIAVASPDSAEIVTRCAVFAESEIISLLHSGVPVASIVRGVYRALASMIHPLILQVAGGGRVSLVGGGANDLGLVEALRERLGADIYVPPHSAYIAAIGAALLGAAHLDGRMEAKVWNR